VAFLAGFVLAGSLAWPTPAQGSAPAAVQASVLATAQASVTPQPATPPQQKRLYLWVIRHALEDTVAFAALVDSARSVGVTDLLVQVRGRGEAYYRSRTEPAPRPLENEPPPGVLIGDRPSEESLRYDPLDTAIRMASERGLRVHAWINLFVVGSWVPKERRTRHVLTQHPEWQIRLRDGRLPENLSATERKQLKLEGIFLDPGHPRVIAYYRGLVRELLWRYAIDGIHFDYVRYPAADAGYGDESRAAFHAAQHEGKIPDVATDADADPWDAWRVGRVSEAVEALSRIARVTAPGIEVSAAVMPDPTEAQRSYKQDWPTWIQQGWCDRVFLMAYTKSLNRLDLWSGMVAGIDPERKHAVFGLGLHVLNRRPLGKMLEYLGGKGITELSLFSDVQFMKSPGMRSTVRRFWEDYNAGQ
jgi:uncharacterized lipoprotein YddW (UPF0748 family)